jgi:glycosyltransferase involved in cell wall biosynthesis
MKNLLIISAYNEEEALPRTIESLQALPGLLKTCVSKT